MGNQQGQKTQESNDFGFMFNKNVIANLIDITLRMGLMIIIASIIGGIIRLFIQNTAIVLGITFGFFILLYLSLGKYLMKIQIGKKIQDFYLNFLIKLMGGK